MANPRTFLKTGKGSIVTPLLACLALAACEAREEAAPVDTPDDLADETVIPRQAGAPDREAVRAAFAASCPALAEQVATAQCEPTGEGTEYACTYRLQNQGRNEQATTYIARDGESWTLIDIPEICAAADDAA